MKANELNCKDLMVGDWVIPHFDSTLEPSKIVGIHYNSYKGKDYEDWVDCEGLDEISLNNIEPIPLTPEILEKNGWIRTKYAYDRDCMEIYGAGELPEGVDNALSIARWSIDKNYQYHFLGLYMWKGSVMQHDVHYVHQLQHAFRVLGIEKEIIL